MKSINTSFTKVASQSPITRGIKKGTNPYKQIKGTAKKLVNAKKHLESLIDDSEKTHKVKSTNLRSVSYNSETQDLTVSFKSNRTYVYADVHKSAYIALVTAQSIGGYFHSNIKNKYAVTEITHKHKKLTM